MTQFPQFPQPFSVLQGGTGQTTQAGLYAETMLQNDQITGSLAYTLNVSLITNATLSGPTTTGTVCVAGIALPAGLVCSNISVLIGTTPAATPQHSWAALLDSTLHVLAVSADKLTGALGASTLITYAMGAAYTTTAQGLFYIAFSSTAGVTAPTLSGLQITAGAIGLTPIQAGTAGLQTTPPALNAQINSGTITGSGQANFAAWIT